MTASLLIPCKKKHNALEPMTSENKENCLRKKTVRTKKIPTKILTKTQLTKLCKKTF